jgi:hypothetical protein
MAFLAAAVLFISRYSLMQVDVAHAEDWLSSPYEDTSWPNTHSAGQALDARFRAPIPTACHSMRFLIGLGLIMPFLLATVWNNFVIALPTSESLGWDCIMRVVLCATAVAVAAVLARFFILWLELRDLLRQIAAVPMMGAFQRLPDQIGRLFIRYLHGEAPRSGHLDALAWARPLGMRATSPKADDLRATAQIILKELPNNDAWRNQTTNQAYGTNSSKEELPAGRITTPAGSVDVNADTYDEYEARQQFVAAYVVLWLGRYFVQLRLLVYGLAFAIPFLLLAAACYPFPPDRPGLDGLVTLLAATGGIVVYVFYSINRDPLVSRIKRTAPGRFTPDMSFLSSIMTCVAPIMLFVLAQVYGLFRFVLEPVLSVFQ